MNVTITQRRGVTRSASPAPPLMTTLDDVIGQCADILPGAVGCGLKLLTTDGRRITSVATDPVAERLNALHDFHQENPCTSAWLRGAAVRADFPRDSHRWGVWATLAGDLGVASVLTVPLRTSRRLLGTLMAYATAGDRFDSSDERALAACAGDAARRVDECLSAARIPRIEIA